MWGERWSGIDYQFVFCLSWMAFLWTYKFSDVTLNQPLFHSLATDGLGVFHSFSSNQRKLLSMLVQLVSCLYVCTCMGMFIFQSSPPVQELVPSLIYHQPFVFFCSQIDRMFVLVWVSFLLFVFTFLPCMYVCIYVSRWLPAFSRNHMLCTIQPNSSHAHVHVVIILMLYLLLHCTQSCHYHYYYYFHYYNLDTVWVCKFPCAVWYPSIIDQLFLSEVFVCKLGRCSTRVDALREQGLRMKLLRTINTPIAYSVYNSCKWLKILWENRCWDCKYKVSECMCIDGVSTFYKHTTWTKK